MRGIVAVSLAMAGFTINDAFIKIVADDLAMTQIMFVRGTIAVFLIAALASWRGQFRFPAEIVSRPLSWRLVGEVGATFCFLTALFNMPIANATAILQAVPLALTLAAALVLGEHVRWRRWMAIVAGFLGMLLIIKPGAEGFNAYSLWAIVSVGFIVIRDIATRYVPRAVPPLIITLLAMAAVTASGLIGMLAEASWQTPTLPHLALLAIAACFLTVGFHGITVGMRLGDVSVVAPFRYTTILWALLLGAAIWGEWPDGLSMIGITLIVGAGLYVFYRERQLSRRAEAA